MRLAHYELDEPLEFKEGKINTLTVENPVFYRKVVSELVEQSAGNQGGFFLSENDKLIEFSSSAEVITDVFNIVFDSRAILTKVSRAVTGEFAFRADETQKIITDINNLANNIVPMLDFPVKFNMVEDFEPVLKLLGFSVDTDNMDFCERLAEYICFLSKYMNKKLFIILNLKSCLSADEQREFFKLMQYKKINILLIENCDREKASENEIIRIIDKDLCEI